MKTTGCLKCRLLAGAAGILGAMSLNLPAHASGFGLPEGAADWLGTAFAGDEAKAYDASTAWNNPAGMALLDEDEVEAGVSFIDPSARFSGYNTNPLSPGSNVSGVEGGNAVASAATGAAFGVFVLSPNWRIGYSVTAPFGERTSYPLNFVGRYQSLVSSITDVNFSVALSYKLSDRLSIGAGPEFDYFDARLTQAINVPVLSQLTGQDAVGDVHGNNIGIGYNIGILYQLDAATRIGADYHSRIRHDITGSQKITVPSSYSALSPATVALLQQGTSAASTTVTLPDSLGVGIYRQVTPAWAVMGSVQWTDWSVLQSLDIHVDNGSGDTLIREHWRNSWSAGIGTNYQFTNRLMLQTGFAFEESPVTDANRTSRVPDANQYDLCFGAQYRLTRAATAEIAYGHAFSPGGSIHSTSSTSALTPSGTIIGAYDDTNNSFTAGVTMKF